MEEMVRIVGVRFKRAGKIYYFSPGELEVAVGDQVLVETAAGLECGEVVIPAKDVPVSDVVQPVRRVVRQVEAGDRQQLVANRDSEREAEAFARERIAARSLPMKLVNAEYTFDRNRLTFFFVAEERVDFRELVKDLASRFGCRIEMRQSGVRDQAKEVGGIGVCGRDLCCTTWLGEFAPVSIRMAKDQELSLNPSKLTGQCGRLKCCLKFEADTYRRLREELPEVGAMVRTSAGTGKVVEVLVARESVAVNLGEGRPVLVSLQQMETGEAVVLTGRLAQTNGAAHSGNGAAGHGAAVNGGTLRGATGGGAQDDEAMAQGASAAIKDRPDPEPGDGGPATVEHGHGPGANGTVLPGHGPHDADDTVAPASGTAAATEAEIRVPDADAQRPGEGRAKSRRGSKGKRGKTGRDAKGRREAKPPHDAQAAGHADAVHDPDATRDPDTGRDADAADTAPADAGPAEPKAGSQQGTPGADKPRAQSRRRRPRRRRPARPAPEAGEEAG